MKRILILSLYLLSGIAVVLADTPPDYSSIFGLWNREKTGELYLYNDSKGNQYYANESSISFDYYKNQFALGMKGGMSVVIGFEKDGEIIKLTLKSLLDTEGKRTFTYKVFMHFVDRNTIWFEIDKNNMSANEYLTAKNAQIEGINNRYIRAKRVSPSDK
jgi:hypothetical protein